MYRPEGLKNPHEDTLPFTREAHIRYDEWNAGADAMLEGLLKGGVFDIIKFTDKDVIIKFKDIVKRMYKRGRWVFIPEGDNE